MNSVLNNNEKIIYKLRELYSKYGYSQYKMSKFEEYDLYSKNKDFLVSDRVITFTDTNGKLMALKPDVTLSIIKNYSEDSSVTRLCYNENIYRVSKGTESFKEIMQVGLECIGDVDDYNINEVLMLSLKSLEEISSNYILDISNLDILSSCIRKVTTNQSEISNIIKLVSEKNIHTILENYKDNDNICYLIDLLKISSNPSKCLDKVKEISKKVNAYDAYKTLKSAISGLDDSRIRIDFSVAADINYYNGIIFKGFIEEIPSSILSGGQYDKLLLKMKKSAKSIGFAVYLDLLDLMNENTSYDVDVMLVYDDFKKAKKEVDKQVKSGKSVFACKKINKKIRYKELICMKEE